MTIRETEDAESGGSTGGTKRLPSERIVDCRSSEPTRALTKGRWLLGSVGALAIVAIVAFELHYRGLRSDDVAGLLTAERYPKSRPAGDLSYRDPIGIAQVRAQAERIASGRELGANPYTGLPYTDKERRLAGWVSHNLAARQEREESKGGVGRRIADVLAFGQVNKEAYADIAEAQRAGNVVTEDDLLSLGLTTKAERAEGEVQSGSSARLQGAASARTFQRFMEAITFGYACRCPVLHMVSRPAAGAALPRTNAGQRYSGEGLNVISPYSPRTAGTNVTYKVAPRAARKVTESPALFDALPESPKPTRERRKT